MLNKGAQAMTFTVISEMKKAFPKSDIVLLPSISHAACKNIKDIYNFEIIQFDIRTRMELSGGLFKTLNKAFKYQNYLKKHNDKLIKIKKYFENADYLIDISGFALSSQMGFRKSCSYLLAIAAAKKHNVVTYIFPQSFGPFNYPHLHNKFIVWLLMMKYMKYPAAVFARETDGLNKIQPFNKMAKLNYDIVLQSNIEYDLQNIFKHEHKREPKLPKIDSNAVAIIPNEKALLHGNESELLNLFNKIIQELLCRNMRVYLLPHSHEDAVICKRLKSTFSHENMVSLITDEYNCIELEFIISKFMFVVASRYHSIVHAYRKSVPVIALGWAEKYQELLSSFGQDLYLFDVRKNPDIDKFINAIDDMIKNHKKNVSEIKQQLSLVQKDSIFKRFKKTHNYSYN